MKGSMKLTAALLACAMAVLPASSGIGAFAAENSTAKTTAAEKKDDKAAKKEKLAHSPLDASDKKAVKAFEESKPKISKNDSSYSYYYGSSITWEPVENALLYYVYIKKPGDVKYSFFAKTYETSVYLSDYASYKVRAVTFTTEDKKVTGKLSDAFEYEKPKYEEDDYYEEEDGYYEVEGEYYEDEDYYEEEVEEEPEYEPEEEVEEEPEIAYATSAVNKNAVPDVSNEEYAHYEESDFKDVTKSPLSTFSADADTASYTNFRRYAANNHLSSLSQDAVRIEEWLNYFDYDYPAPTGKNLFSVTSEVAKCPWNEDALVMMIGVRAKDLAEEPRSNYVFLVDVSGSMDEPDKLPLVKQSINSLTESLTDKDTISIVTYSGAEATVLCGAKGNAVNTVKEMTECMNAWGSTNGEGGIKEAYRIAENLFIEGGNNRIIMASDGDLNVGIYDTNELTKLVENKRESGVYLTVLGFGEGNLKDEKMSALADNGNGSYHYIDCAEEAEKVLVEEGHQTLYTVAKDVKFQVEFNPETVSGYRLIGYDKRALKNEDFDNDKVDAAEVGANQTVTVLYELIPAKTKSGSLKYQKSTGNKTEFCTFRINCKNPETGKSYKVNEPIKKVEPKMSANLAFASAVAETAMYFKGSSYAGTSSPTNAYKLYMSKKDEINKNIGYAEGFGDMLAVIKDSYPDPVDSGAVFPKEFKSVEVRYTEKGKETIQKLTSEECAELKKILSESTIFEYTSDKEITGDSLTLIINGNTKYIITIDSKGTLYICKLRSDGSKGKTYYIKNLAQYSTLEKTDSDNG